MQEFPNPNVDNAVLVELSAEPTAVGRSGVAVRGGGPVRSVRVRGQAMESRGARTTGLGLSRTPVGGHAGAQYYPAFQHFNTGPTYRRRRVVRIVTITGASVA